MALMLTVFGLLTVLELCVASRWLWPVHRPLAAGTAITLALVSGGLLGMRFSLAMIVVSIISLYRVVGLLRLVQDRSEQHHLRRASHRTTVVLSGLQFLILAALAIADEAHPFSNSLWATLAIVQLTVAIVLYVSLQRHSKTTQPLAVSEHFSDAQLPSISVCIPARNETAALEDCLRSLVASDYPKLEIIVLDDCSQGTRTSDIIRGFAHDGVRFIKGDIPPDAWLAKNWAYQQLLKASSGDLVLFCGVDIRFERSALRNLVTTQLAKNKRMVSVMPQNFLPAGWRNQLALLIQPARYAWELCPPRRLFNRPPVLSSCWIAERKLLASGGSFAAVAGSISPEAYFARRAIHRDGYSFIVSAGDLAITSHKGLDDQWQTAVRTRYPQLRRRPENVLIMSAVELFVLIGPLPLTVIGIANGLLFQALTAGLATIIGALTYDRMVELTYRQPLSRGLFLGPFAVLLDIYLRHESLWRYEFGEITWKGRNVCLPVMRVIPRLPKI